MPAYGTRARKGMTYTMTHLPHDAMTDAQDHPPTDSASDHVSSVELDALLQPRHSARKRLVQAGSIIVAVLLVIGFLVYPHWAGGFGHDDVTLPSTSTPDVPDRAPQQCHLRLTHREREAVG